MEMGGPTMSIKINGMEKSLRMAKRGRKKSKVNVLEEKLKFHETVMHLGKDKLK